jgi:tRNA A-37 threonylcarbamoyl transferase component Bud32
MSDTSEAAPYSSHREFFRDIIQEIYGIMEKEYGLSGVSVTPIGAEGARLSLPIRIEGIDKAGTNIKYFGKLLGSSELLTAKTIQFFKNIYLDINSMDPLFEVMESAEDLARHQYDMLVELNKIGIPTAKPLGVYPLRSKLCLLVLEFVHARPINEVPELTEAQVDTVFSYLRKMHDHDLFHGDIKPDNLMFGDEIFMIDVGNFRDDAPKNYKMSYDLACQIVSFLAYMPVEVVVKIAGEHYTRRELRAASKYLDIVQKRPDIVLNEKNMELLLRLLE